MVNDPSQKDVYNEHDFQPKHPAMSESEAVSTLTKSKECFELLDCWQITSTYMHNRACHFVELCTTDGDIQFFGLIN